MIRSDFILIRGCKYEQFSIEKHSEGGWKEVDLKQSLRDVGICFTMKDDRGVRAYSPYVGKWSIYIEAVFANEVSSWLWGNGKLVGRGKNES